MFVECHNYDSLPYMTTFASTMLRILPYISNPGATIITLTSPIRN